MEETMKKWKNFQKGNHTHVLENLYILIIKKEDLLTVTQEFGGGNRPVSLA
jgi:hypothetical protein